MTAGAQPPPLSGLGRPRALVVLNPAACHGTAARRFETVRGAVEAAFSAETLVTDPDGAWTKRVAQARDDGVRVFLAAGGDGTVHGLVNALLPEGEGVPGLVLGGIGLGSSNDFHKPVRQTLGRIPVCLDVGHAQPRDLVRARWEDPDGHPRTRVFAISASLGVTAAANGLFNRGDPILRQLKGRWTGGAILWAALRTLATWRNLDAHLTLEGHSEAVALANLSVLETPFLSGSFRYDTPVDDHDGRMVVNLIEDLGRWRLLALLLALARGRFQGRRGTRTWTTTHLEVDLPAPVDLELDGEVFTARRVTFDVLPRRILRCA